MIERIPQQTRPWLAAMLAGLAALAVALLGCGLVSLAAVLYSEHGRLFRRLTPPGMARPVTGPELN